MRTRVMGSGLRTSILDVRHVLEGASPAHPGRFARHCGTCGFAVTRKFVYDPHVERVRMVAWTPSAHGALGARRWRSLQWLVAALVVVAAALAFDAVHAAAEDVHTQGGQHGSAAK
jgi:hypothetical protein